MLKRNKSSGSRPKLTGRPKHGSYVLRNVGLFAGYTDDSVLDQDDAFDLAEQLASHKPGDDASGAGEDAIPHDRDDRRPEAFISWRSLDAWASGIPLDRGRRGVVRP